MRDAVISFPGLGLEMDPPASVSIFGRNIYLYGIIIGIGFLLAVVYCCRRAPQFGLNTDKLIDMLIFAVPLAIICARAYYVIFEFDRYRDNLWSIFYIWEGGLAIYGGIIGAVIGVIIFGKVKKVSIGATLDLGSLGLFIGQAVGRWGNFFNREAFGSETDLPWRMGLTRPGYETIYVHPTFLYECLWNVVGLIICHIYSKRRKYDGQIFLMYVAWYGLGRAWIEGLRTDSLYISGTHIRVSQVLAIAAFLVSTVILIYQSRKEHPPEKLYVNQVRAQQAEAEAAAQTAAQGEAAPAEAAAEDAAQTGTEPELPEERKEQEEHGESE